MRVSDLSQAFDAMVVSSPSQASVAWPNNLPDPRFFPTGGVAGLLDWVRDAPGRLRADIAARVLHKEHAKDSDFNAIVSWEDLFTVYAVCNSEGQIRFVERVVALTAIPIPGIKERTIPLPACIPLAERYSTVVYRGMSDFLLGASPSAADAMRKAYAGTPLDGPVATVRINALYNLMNPVDRMIFLRQVEMYSPAPLVETVPNFPPIGQPDPPQKPTPPSPPKEPTPPSKPTPPASPEPGPEVPVDPPIRDGFPAGTDLPEPHWNGSRPPKVPEDDTPPTFYACGVPKHADLAAPLPTVPGHCGLALVVPAARDKLHRSLGFNPWSSALAACLLGEPGVWSPGKFKLTVGCPVVTQTGPAYLQAHVEPDPSGVKVRELLPFLSGFMRVGMASSELSSLLSLQAESASSNVASVFDIKPSGPSTRVQLGVTARLDAQNPSLAWNVFSTPTLALMLGIYESVRVEKVDFVATVSPGMDNTLWAAITASGVVLRATNDWLSAPVTNTIHGSSTGVVRGTFGLPQGHQFAREIRMATLGNTAPTFHFNYQGAAGTSARLTGTIVVHVSGAAVLGHVNISTKLGKAAAMFTAAGIANTLGYSVALTNPTLDPADCFDAGEVSDDDEPEHALPATSPSAANSVGSQHAVNRPT